jgi:hypothetical protein
MDIVVWKMLFAVVGGVRVALFGKTVIALVDRRLQKRYIDGLAETKSLQV